MARLFNRLFRTVKRRIKKGLRDQRTYNLHRAAHRLLANHDHEQISIAQLSREAGISVGAFYQRFPTRTRSWGEWSLNVYPTRDVNWNGHLTQSGGGELRQPLLRELSSRR